MAHPDLDKLLNAALEFAQQMLNKYGGFHPFGASMDQEGKIVMDATTTGQEHPPAQELIDLLSAAYVKRAESGELRAAALCTDVRVPAPGATEKTDAISVGLEHNAGEAVTVFLPYKKGLLGRMRYGTLFASARDKVFFR